MENILVCSENLAGGGKNIITSCGENVKNIKKFSGEM